MCEECDRANGIFVITKEEAAAKKVAELEVSPQTTSTMTVITTSPEGGIPSTPSLENIANSI